MSIIRLNEWKNTFRSRQFKQISSLICLLATVLCLFLYCFLTVQHVGTLQESMSDAADLLAMRVQDQLANMRSTSLYLSSLDLINTLLVQESPPIKSFSEYDKVLDSMGKGNYDVEILFHKSGKILISDYGLSTYQEYFDQSFLQTLSQQKIHEKWFLRSYQKNIYTKAKNTITFVHSLPISSIQNSGYIVINQSLSAIEKTAGNYAESGLGHYAVWLDDLLLTTSGDIDYLDRMFSCASKLETTTHAVYWMPWPTLIECAVPNPLNCLIIYAGIMFLCLIASYIICRQRIVQLNTLVREFGGNMEGTYDDQLNQLYRIFETLTSELTHARQTTRDGLPLLQERLVGELMRTSIPINVRKNQLDAYGIKLKHPYYAVVQAVLQVDTFDGQTHLMVRRNIQAQLAELGTVYSTYGDGNSILFLLNAPIYHQLDEKLESLCETMHDALMSFLGVDVLFAIGVCLEDKPSPNQAYTTARDQLSKLKALDEQAQETVVLAHPGQQSRLHRDIVQSLCSAIASQDMPALETALANIRERYLTQDLSIEESTKRCRVFLLLVSSSLIEMDFQLSNGEMSAFRQLNQCVSSQEIWQTASDWCRSLISGDAVTSDENNLYVEKALDYIHSNYTKTINVSEIAEYVCVNPIYLNRLFKSYTGNTISNYLSQYRCEHARTMLEQTQATINEISNACGFSEVRSFIRFFKKYYEQTPTEYRKQLRDN